MSDGVCDGCGNEKVMLCLNCHGHDEDAEITRLRARLAELEAECDRLQSLANVYRTEVMASRNERAAFFSRTMNYEEWQAASRQVEIARADTESARAANGEVG